MIDDRVYQITQEICQAIKESIFNRGLDVSGNLYNSVQTYFDYDGESYSVTVELADYWKYVEEGRGSGKFPPPDQIKDWIRFKHIVPTAKSSQKIPSTNQLAYMISRKISEKGTKATHFLEETLESPQLQALFDEIEEVVYSSLIKDVNEEIDKL